MSQFDVTSKSQHEKPQTASGDRPRVPGSILRPPRRDHTVLTAKLTQSYNLNRQRINRIIHLEKTLDQALSCLDDLKGQLCDQEMIEAQLAKTESFANLQQKALFQLKQQIDRKNQTLEAQTLEIFTRDQIIHTLQTSLDEQQQQWAECEQQRLLQQERLTALEAELTAAHREITTLEASQQQTDEVLHQVQALAAERHSALLALQEELAIAQLHIAELDAQLLTQQRKVQTLWQQDCQEATVERDRSQTRIQQLEQRSADLQEQVMQQAHQAHEYETAVQHWKDRYLASQRQLAYFKQLVDQAFPHSSPDTHFDHHIPVTQALLELLTAIHSINPAPQASPITPTPQIPTPTASQASPAPVPPQTPPTTAPRPATKTPAPEPTHYQLEILEIPEFLTRRRQRTQRNGEG